MTKTKCDDCPMISAAFVEEIAERAAEKAIEKLTARLYEEIGRSVLSKILYLLGVCTVGFWFWLRDKGAV